jgi:protein required for attachment to host cells
MSRTWILVANRARARLFEFDDRDRSVSEIRDFLHPDGRLPAGSRGENRPPRTMDRMGPGRHAIEPQTEPVNKHAQRFARELATLLEDGRVHNRFEHLVLIATPRFLGHLRQCLEPGLRGLVSREVRRDMTRGSVQAIQAAATAPFPESA